MVVPGWVALRHTTRPAGLDHPPASPGPVLASTAERATPTPSAPAPSGPPDAVGAITRPLDPTRTDSVAAPSDPSIHPLSEVIAGLDAPPADWREFNPETLTLTLSGVPISFDRVSAGREGGRLVWVGRTPTVSDEHDGWVVAVASPGGYVAQVSFAEGLAYTVSAAKLASVAAATSALPCGTPDTVRPVTAADIKDRVFVEAGAASTTDTGTSADAAINGVNYSDVAFLVNSAAIAQAQTDLNKIGSTQAPLDYFENGERGEIASCNIWLVQSGVTNLAWRFAGITQIPDYDLNGDKSMTRDMEVLTNTGTAAGTAAGAAAQAFFASQGADQLALIVEHDRTHGGTGEMPGHHVVISYSNAQFGGATLAHELAHNFGCNHDRANAFIPVNLSGFNFGHAFTANGVTYGTIMCYLGAHTTYFSNPNVTYLGVPTGVTEGQENAANNARVLRDGAGSMSAYHSLPGSPVITSQPAGRVAIAGALVTFHVVATGANLAYQWAKDGIALAGQTTDTLTLSAVSSSDAGNYSVVVSNEKDSVMSSSATLSIAAAAAPSSNANSGGGGGSHSAWFLVSLAALAMLRARRMPSRLIYRRAILPSTLLILALVGTASAQDSSWYAVFLSKDLSTERPWVGNGASEAVFIERLLDYQPDEINAPPSPQYPDRSDGFFGFAQKVSSSDGRTYLRFSDSRYYNISATALSDTFIIEPITRPSPPPPAPEYILSAAVRGVGVIDKIDSSYKQNYVATPQAVAADGWRFDHWEGDASGTDPSPSILMDRDKSITAVFVALMHNVAVSASGPGTTSGGGTYNHGDTAQVQGFPSEHAHFERWEGSASTGDNPYAFPVSGDASLNAVFAYDAYTLITTTSGSGAGSVTGGGSYIYPASATAVATAAAGSHFVRWENAASGTSSPATIAMDAPKTVNAVFDLNRYPLSTTTNGHGSVAGGGTYDHGASATLAATPDSGWHFVRWEGDVSGATSPTALVMTAPHTVTAVFAIDQHTLTADVSGSGSVTGAGTYDHGTAVELHASAAPRWVFDHWTGDLAGNANPATITVNGDTTLTAVFQPAPAPTATIAATPAGGIEPLKTTLTWSTAHADSVTVSGPGLTAATPDGSLPLTLAAGTYSFLIEADGNGHADDQVTITVERASFRLTTQVEGPGAITPGGIYPRPNPMVTAVTLTATPEADARFTGFSGDIRDTVAGTMSLFVPMDGDRLIVANFSAKLPQSISVEHVGGRHLKDGPFAVSASATSGLPVIISVVAGPATAAGNLITPTGEGAIVLGFSQPGDATFLAAPPVTASFDVINPVKAILYEERNDAALSDGRTTTTNYGTKKLPTKLP